MTKNTKVELISNEEKLEENPKVHGKSTNKFAVVAVLIAIVIIALIVLAMIFLLDPSNSGKTSQIRDVFIILMALISVIIGIALVLLIFQLSVLINLLRNEIKSIINSASETVNTLRGTATFISDNLAEPVIKVNTFAARIKSLFRSKRK